MLFSPQIFFSPRRLIFTSYVEFGTPVSNLFCFLKSVEWLKSYGHLTNQKTSFGAGFKKVSPYQPKEGLKLKNYIIRQGQTFSVLAQTWHTGSLGQVFRRDFFVWLKNRNGQDMDKNGQK